MVLVVKLGVFRSIILNIKFFHRKRLRMLYMIFYLFNLVFYKCYKQYPIFLMFVEFYDNYSFFIFLGDIIHSLFVEIINISDY